MTARSRYRMGALAAALAALALAGCGVVSTTASVAGTAVTTAVDVTATVVETTVDIIVPDGDDE